MATFEEYGAQVIAIASAPESIAGMREKVEVQFPLYADPDLDLIKAWGVADLENEISYPATFVVDGEAKIRYVHVGEHKADRPLLEDVIMVVRYLAD